MSRPFILSNCLCRSFPNHCHFLLTCRGRSPSQDEDEHHEVVDFATRVRTMAAITSGPLLPI